MTPSAVTGTLLHHLVAGSHAEGITTLGVEAAIGHDDCVLLIAEPGPDFTGETWHLPGGPVLPGQPLTDAPPPAAAAIALPIDQATRYLGHHHHAAPHTDATALPASEGAAAITALDVGLPCYGGGQRRIRLAASLAGGIPVNLRDALAGIDDRGIRLVVKAVQHASGQRP